MLKYILKVNMYCTVFVTTLRKREIQRVSSSQSLIILHVDIANNNLKINLLETKPSPTC